MQTVPMELGCLLSDLNVLYGFNMTIVIFLKMKVKATDES